MGESLFQKQEINYKCCILLDTTTNKRYTQPLDKIMNMNLVWPTKTEHGVV
jgi:hypothetical protein